MEVQVVIPADLLQVGKVGDHRGLLAAEGQVDEVRHIGSAQFIYHPLKLCQLAVRETIQPLGQIVQFIHIDLTSLQAFQRRDGALDLICHTVSGLWVPNVQRLQHPDGAVVLVRRDGEGDGDQAVFQVVCVIECCSDLHGRSPFHSIFLLWFSYSPPHCPSRETRGQGRGSPHSGRIAGRPAFGAGPGGRWV